MTCFAALLAVAHVQGWSFLPDVHLRGEHRRRPRSFAQNTTPETQSPSCWCEVNAVTCHLATVSDVNNSCGDGATSVKTEADCIVFASTPAARGPSGTGQGGTGICSGGQHGTSYVPGCEGCGGDGACASWCRARPSGCFVEDEGVKGACVYFNPGPGAACGAGNTCELVCKSCGTPPPSLTPTPLPTPEPTNPVGGVPEVGAATDGATHP